MKRNTDILFEINSKLGIAKICFIIILINIIIGFNKKIDAQSVSIWPVEISFNYEAGNTYDAVKIRQNASTDITAPEYTLSQSKPFAYLMGQSSRIIKVKFNSSDNTKNYLVKATVISGAGIGNICEVFVASCDLNSRVFTIELSGSIPNSVGKRTFTWKWEATALPINSPYCPITCTSINTTHTYYTLLATPQAPVTEPWTEILDYACVWANGKGDANSICVDILNNGFNAHYTWDMNCHRLSSDFVWIVTSMGISASLHRWASQNYYIGDMAYQRTKSIDPVGSTWGQGVIEWSWHQWAEAVSVQRDPSANVSKSGSWGAYEDDLFTHYLVLIESNPYSQWVSNQQGQNLGCEAPSHRLYYCYPPSSILYDWRGPDR